MQVFFAISCLLAVLALSNGASIAPNSEQPRAELETLDAVSVSETHQVAEAAGQTRTAEVQADEEVASNVTAVELQSTVQEVQTAADASTSGNEETEGVAREKRTLLHRLRTKSCGLGCSGLGGCGSGCGQAVVEPCLQAGGCGPVCGGAGPCAPGNVVVVPRPVPVAQPVHIPVNVVKVVRHPVPVPLPVPVPVTKFVPVPVPVEQPCCG